MDTQRSRLTELREQIRLARVEKQQLADKITVSTNDYQKQFAVHRYNTIVGNLKGMVADLEHAIDASKHAFEYSRRNSTHR